MSYDKKLMAALWNNVDKVATKHITLVDSKFFELEEVPEITIPEDRNLLWSEPLDGLYLVDVNIARYFRDTCSSVEELFREAVQAGYIVRSKAFRVPLRLQYIPPVKSISPRIAVLTLFSSKAKTKIWQRIL